VNTKNIELIACCLFLPVLLGSAISFFKPMLVPRFLLVCLPVAIALATCGIAQLRQPLAVLVLGVVAISSFGSVLWFYRRLPWKEDWRGATRYVLSHCEPDAHVVVVPTYGRFTFDYYRHLASDTSKSIVVDNLDPEGHLPVSPPGRSTWLLISAAGASLPEAKPLLRDFSALIPYRPWSLGPERTWSVTPDSLFKSTTSHPRSNPGPADRSRPPPQSLRL
jgi:hypothetical protein